MSASPILTEAKGASLGARLYDAMVDNSGRFDLIPTMSQAYYERAAVRFTASLTYAESEGVREALLSSVLLDAVRPLAALADKIGPNAKDDACWCGQDGAVIRYRDIRAAAAAAALAQAEAAR